ncbi:MAG: hypothetical protein GTO55_11715 [Armatimonadetes bacterium]|nr:hypothetical protein [Armatimonadota bacterium]NIM24884.1 hypothetical protein [Armatimonadota bacterium]NIM68773.1 hypothetical protein [Armatimonadota bacterium]NIM77035.1 hypothetical protein [Armatimonadota bacterium]NIN06970.1 hypothetical protein [Armatimonadota bacterium]
MRLSNLSFRVNASYSVALLVALSMHYGMKTQAPFEPQTVRILIIVLFGLGILEYLTSLWLEARRLRPQAIQATIRSDQAKSVEGVVASAGIIRAAMGVAPATYAMIFSFLGLQPALWFWLMLATTALAYIHQRFGWDRYEQAVRDAGAFSR